ncbi:MAG: aminotransferase class V-fold PLP-dependent enzyme [Candidatus Heimdallarchaeota archaeon]|nr:aminotransferase class V-fold PLP-dependent enzyme [Candidatus Heimdallarchaeota archaeon]MCK4955386.1 aminotransferase class V-fold PLP-dependent enzyme [Candidatus Heimdallarchaeota archaeon]
MDSFVEQIRNDSPTLKELNYLNHASTGPLHGRTADALQNYLNCWTLIDYTEPCEAREDVRNQFAQVINASSEEITFTPDVTHGSKIAANILDYDEDSNIVCYWNDYPGQVYQALYLQKTKGVEYRQVADRKNILTPEDFAEKVDDNTKLVLLSHVQWISGFKADLKEIAKIAHENDAFILVDTIQSSGALVNDVRDWDVDFLTCGVTKWLLGPDQKGLFFMKKKLINEFYPPFAGYHGTDQGSLFDPYWNVNKLEYLNTIDRYKDTNPGSILYYIAHAGMQILLDYGIKNVENRIFQLTDYLIDELNKLGDYEFITPTDREFRSGIINIRLPDNVEIAKKLKQQKIIVSSRYGGIRISPHFYNTEEDIDNLIDTLKKIL